MELNKTALALLVGFLHHPQFWKLTGQCPKLSVLTFNWACFFISNSISMLLLGTQYFFVNNFSLFAYNSALCILNSRRGHQFFLGTPKGSVSPIKKPPCNYFISVKLKLPAIVFRGMKRFCTLQSENLINQYLQLYSICSMTIDGQGTCTNFLFDPIFSYNLP